MNLIKCGWETTTHEAYSAMQMEHCHECKRLGRPSCGDCERVNCQSDKEHIVLVGKTPMQEGKSGLDRP